MSDPQYVDAHAHLVPDALIEMVIDRRVDGVSLEGGALVSGDGRLGPLRRDMTSVPNRLRWMDEESISEQWVSPWLDLFTWRHLPNDPRRAWVATVNRALGDATASSDGRLRPVPFVDVSLGARAASDDFDAVVDALDPPVVMVNSAPVGVTLADEGLAVFWERLVERNLTVMLHPPGNGPSCSFTRPVMQNVSGRVIDASAAIVELMAAGLFERLPGLRVIVVHGGGFLPYQAFRLDGLVRAGLLENTQMRRPPSEILKGFWYDTVALDPASLELLVRRVGHSRVLLGSDAPFPIGDPHPAATVQTSALTDEAKLAICCDNARQLVRASTEPTGNVA